jgi:peptidoglycan-associated lipoprotein
MMAMNRFLNENIYFDFDDATLDDMAQELLRQKAMWLQDNPDGNVMIEGHCDERGTNAYNLALGERRAEAVKSFLVDLGISDARLTTISYGEEKPLDMGQNEEAWAKNRRAAFQKRNQPFLKPTKYAAIGYEVSRCCIFYMGPHHHLEGYNAKQNCMDWPCGSRSALQLRASG